MLEILSTRDIKIIKDLADIVAGEITCRIQCPDSTVHIRLPAEQWKVVQELQNHYIPPSKTSRADICRVIMRHGIVRLVYILLGSKKGPRRKIDFTDTDTATVDKSIGIGSGFHRKIANAERRLLGDYISRTDMFRVIMEHGIRRIKYRIGRGLPVSTKGATVKGPKRKIAKFFAEW